jgi:hypothetical protein
VAVRQLDQTPKKARRHGPGRLVVDNIARGRSSPRGPEAGRKEPGAERHEARPRRRRGCLRGIPDSRRDPRSSPGSPGERHADPPSSRSGCDPGRGSR